MQIDEKILKEHLELYEKHAKLIDDQQMELARIKDENGTREHEIMRDDKTIKVKEKDLWEEVRYGIPQSRELMFSLYPQIKESVEKIKTLSNKIQAFELKNFGFNLQSMNPAKMIQLVRGLIKLEINK